MKKIFGLLIVFIVCLGIVGAEVTQHVTFVDVNTQPLGGDSIILFYDQLTDGSLVYQGESTVSGTGADIVYATNIPAGVQDYWTFFLKDGYLPWFMENDYSGTGEVDYNAKFLKAADCHAPIREPKVLNVDDPTLPVLINVETEVDGSVYSPFIFNPQRPDVSNFIRQEFKGHTYEDHFSATTNVNLIIYDSNGNEVHSETQSMELFVDESELFQFTWYPAEDGEYNFTVYSEVVDNQCSSSRIEDASIVRDVYRRTDLRNSCDASIPSGITLTPVEPVVNQEATISGTKRTTYYDSSLDETTVPTNLYLTIWDSQGNEVHRDSQSLPANLDEDQPEAFEFKWTPQAEGVYNLELAVVADSDLCTNMNTPEIHTLGFTVGTSSVNYAPSISTIPDRNVNLGTTSTWQIDLWQYTQDETADDQLTFSMSESNTTPIDCSLDNNRYITCGQANQLGTNTITVTASDGTLQTSKSFNVNVLKVSSPDDETKEDEDFGEGLYISSLTLKNGEVLYPGEDLFTRVTVKNLGNDLEDVTVTAVIPDLGIRRRAGPFDIDHNDQHETKLILDIPEYAEPGEYAVRFVMRDADNEIYRVKHRVIEII
ncbi:hypothetical protein KY328_05810 [Candidatus Woesearchaeota archaeon]|nr:hypothetical protein [Candidatus Woesearchaeota archaeon]MBW3022415.1 hypothetical protein [Candidatus Woesearchaeota archaeon]